MCKTTPKGLITRIVTHYVSVIDRQRKFYTSLAALAHEGRLKSRHEYVFFLVAALSGPRAPSNNGWLSYTHLDPTVVDGPAKFAGMFKCAAGNTQLSFQGRRIHAGLGADTLTIDAFAPTSVITPGIATALADRAVPHLDDLFGVGQPGEVIALTALLLPPKGLIIQLPGLAGGALPPSWPNQTSGGGN